MSKLTIKASRRMAAELNKNSKYSIKLLQLPDDIYSRYVSTFWNDHIDDYSFNTGKYNLIIVEYPDDYYAMPRYITTDDLLSIFNHSDKTYTGFIEGFNDYIAI